MVTTSYKWTIRFSLLTPLLLLIAVLLMGGGHGWYEPSMTLFPFGMVGTIFQDTITLPFIISGIIQYPLYGFIIDKARSNPYKKTAILAVVITHITLAGLILFRSGEHWK